MFETLTDSRKGAESLKSESVPFAVSSRMSCKQRRTDIYRRDLREQGKISDGAQIQGVYGNIEHDQIGIGREIDRSISHGGQYVFTQPWIGIDRNVQKIRRVLPTLQKILGRLDHLAVGGDGVVANAVRVEGELLAGKSADAFIDTGRRQLLLRSENASIGKRKKEL